VSIPKRFLAGGQQEVGEERDAIVFGVKPRDGLALRFEEHVYDPKHGGRLTRDQIDGRTLQNAPDHWTVVHVEPSSVAGEDPDLAYLDPVGFLHGWQAHIE
jgi:hypothetical protein